MPPPLTPHGGYAKQTPINKLQTFQNNVLGIIPQFPAVTPTQIPHNKSEQMPSIHNRPTSEVAIHWKISNSGIKEI